MSFYGLNCWIGHYSWYFYIKAKLMSHSSKILLGIFSIIPIALLIFMFIYLFMYFIPEMIKLDELGTEPDPRSIIQTFGSFFVFIVLINVLYLGFMIYFIVHVVKDPSASSEDRLLWILLLIFLNIIVFPIYWYFRIWRPRSMSSERVESHYSN